MKKSPDIEISGQGFYTIRAASKRAEHWMRRVQGFDGHAAYSDDTRMTQDIADGAVISGLLVTVEGRHYRPLHLGCQSGADFKVRP